MTTALVTGYGVTTRTTSNAIIWPVDFHLFVRCE